MTNYKTGDILLLIFPYSNLNGSKKRPAIVCKDTGDSDVIVARITSSKPKDIYDWNIVDWKNSGLLVPSTIRIHKIATLDKQLIDKQLGYLSAKDLITLKNALANFWIHITTD